MLLLLRGPRIKRAERGIGIELRDVAGGLELLLGGADLLLLLLLGLPSEVVVAAPAHRGAKLLPEAALGLKAAGALAVPNGALHPGRVVAHPVRRLLLLHHWWRALKLLRRWALELLRLELLLGLHAAWRAPPAVLGVDRWRGRHIGVPILRRVYWVGGVWVVHHVRAREHLRVLREMRGRTEDAQATTPPHMKADDKLMQS